MDAFYGILKSQVIWLTNNRYMNDKYEGIWINTIVDKFIKESRYKYGASELENFYKYFHSQKNKIFYLSCFSKNEDDSHQWKKYACNGKGVAIGFSKDAIGLIGSFSLGLAIIDVEYDILKQMNVVEESFILAMKKDYISSATSLKELSIWAKNPSFVKENEVRLIYSPDDFAKKHLFTSPGDKQLYELFRKNISDTKYKKNQNNEIPYVTYDLHGTIKGFTSELIPRIILGPNNTEDEDAVRSILDKLGLDATIVSGSDL